jgi:hypothetical protein
MLTNDFDTDQDTKERARPTSFGQRHALKILGTIMVVLFATVIVAQVAC